MEVEKKYKSKKYATKDEAVRAEALFIVASEDRKKRSKSQ